MRQIFGNIFIHIDFYKPDLEKKVNVVLTGNVGPNAFKTLQAAQINVVTGISGAVKEVYEKYKSGGFDKTTQGPTVDSHYGLNA